MLTISIVRMIIIVYLYNMKKNTFRKSIDLPKNPNFRKSLKKQAIDEGFDSPKQMIEHKTIESVKDYEQKNEIKNG